MRVTLAGLWLFPTLISVHMGYWRFISIWIAFSAATAYVLHLAMGKPLSVQTPWCARERVALRLRVRARAGGAAYSRALTARRGRRRVYGWFFWVYRISCVLAVAGYAIILAEVLGFALVLPESVAGTATLMLFYGLYYGVLGRDLAEVCADKMSATLGVCGVRCL